MKYLLKQPLTHFLLIGLALFVIFEFTSNRYEDEDSKTVIVDRDALLTFIQYRSKAFDNQRFEEKLSSMSEQELKLLIDDYIREEVLYREALALNLDKDDYVLRRRLVQKLEFINQGFTEDSIDLKEKDINQFFEKNKDDYYVEPYTTFTHVFFGSRQNGREKAEELAKNELKVLNSNQVPFAKATEHGDRFLYHVNYVERTPEYVASHFGPEMTKAVFELETSDKVWKGPFKSQYGYHLVMATANVPGRYPEIEEIYEQVKQDAQFAFTKEKTEKTIQDIIDSYDVQIIFTKGDEDQEHSETARSSESVVNKTAQ